MSYCIKVENLSKKYILSHQKKEQYLSLRDLIAQKTKNIFSSSTEGTSSHVSKKEFHALKDVSFTLEKGDRLGIIGRNGAGKSTLLKILSRVVEPDQGRIHIKGRIASLLEVGTGFHAELSGRENIFLNGAILGLTKSEIKKQFDEIVAFAEIETFLDTPVKRYSSGMYVKLAFAVAAHLDPEILILDEVLAVGDAQFQKKCLGKMEDVSKNEGRTIIFVSHNMQVVQKLCNKGLLLHHGQLMMEGNIDPIVNKYLEIGDVTKAVYEIPLPADHTGIPGYATKIQIEDLKGNLLSEVPVGAEWQARIQFKLNRKTDHFILGFGIITSHDLPFRTSWTEPKDMDPGLYEAVFINDDILLTTGVFNLAVGLSTNEIPFHFVNSGLKMMISEVTTLINNKRIVNSQSGIVINPMKVDVQLIG